MTVHYLGIRHHSPACAHWVKQRIVQLQPVAVLIEGPCDFNERINELLLPHKLPIALFSYRYNGEHSAQSWFPFLDYSPEWVALQEGNKQQAALYFIDLPHWSYRVRNIRQQATRQPKAQLEESLEQQNRYQYVLDNILQKTGCDNQDALWDTWFEHAPKEELPNRLAHYFQTLRGDAVGDSEDQLREQFMAQWIRYIASQHEASENIVVVCGGWHVAALKRLLAEHNTTQNTAMDSEPQPQTFVEQLSECQAPSDSLSTMKQTTTTTQISHQGSYLIPYEFRQVDALSGYGAGMPSPQYYQWLYETPQQAYTKAITQITQQLRQAKQTISTADLMAWQHTTLSLAMLRGRGQATQQEKDGQNSEHQPSRHDLLDGFINSCIKEALETLPPWSDNGKAVRTLQVDDHPALRAALLALTGDRRGQLAKNTPLPPLLADTEKRLQAHDVLPTVNQRRLTLNWRDPYHRKQLNLLWQLYCIGCDSVRVDIRFSPHVSGAAQPRTLFTAEETWHLQRHINWEVQLIEASRFGATLALAAKAAIAEKLLTIQTDTPGAAEQAVSIGEVFAQVIRAGFLSWGDTLAQRIATLLPQIHERDSLTHIGTHLMHLRQQGFWGGDIEALLAQPFHLVIERLMWLLDGTARHSSQSPRADIDALKLIDYVLHKETTDNNIPAIIDLLHRMINDRATTATLRGAALGVYHNHLARQRPDDYDEGKDTDSGDKIDRIDSTAIINALPTEYLGDFLNGLFACARETIQRQDKLLPCLHEVISGLTTSDFLAILPALRTAFSWFSAKERQTLAIALAQQMGLDPHASYVLQQQIASPINDVDILLRAKNRQSQVEHWLRQIKGT